MHNIPLIILGSARKKSNTRCFSEAVFQGRGYSLLDLLDFHIAPYSYEEDYPPDDGFPELSQILLQHQLIVFATPVYWYAMSGLLKVFFDRLTDLITIRKESGRQLRGRITALLAVGSDDALPDGFTVPFSSTSRYLGMEFIASAYAPIARLKDDEFIRQQRTAFLQKLNRAHYA